MNAKVRKHTLRQLAKRTPEQVAADIEDLKRISLELRKAVKKGKEEKQIIEQRQNKAESERLKALLAGWEKYPPSPRKGIAMRKIERKIKELKGK